MDANYHITVVATEINGNVISTKIKSLLQRKMQQPQLWGSAFSVISDEPIPPNLLSYRRKYSSPILHFYRTVCNVSNHFRNKECLILDGLKLNGSFVIPGTQVGPSEESLHISLFLWCWNTIPGAHSCKKKKKISSVAIICMHEHD